MATIQKILQVGFVVKDCEAKVKNLEKYYGLGPAKVVDSTKAKFASGLTYKGRDVDFDVKIAMINIGEVQLELIQPLDESLDNPYYAHLVKKGEGLHHLAVHVDDNDSFKNMMSEHGNEEITSGNITGKFTYRYFNTLDEIGTILEIYEPEN